MFFLSKLRDIFKFIDESAFSAVYFFGDWNINLLKPNNTQVNKFISLMYSNYLLPSTTKPTRVGHNTASLIDHIWSNQTELNLGNFIINTDITDHFPVVSYFRKSSLNEQAIKYAHKRVFHDDNKARFLECVSELTWGDVYESQCPEHAYNIFYNKFNEKFQQHFPLIRFKHTNKTEKCPYITAALKRSIRRNIALRDWRTGGH